MTKLLNAFQWIKEYILYSHFGRILASAVIAAISFLLTHLVDSESLMNKILVGIGFTGIGIAALYTLVLTVFAFIINPLKNKKK
jgi:hypothetical protein